MVRRKKTSIFLDAKESTTVLELKKMVRGITKKGVEEMKLYKDDQVIYIVELVNMASGRKTFCSAPIPYNHIVNKL